MPKFPKLKKATKKRLRNPKYKDASPWYVRGPLRFGAGLAGAGLGYINNNLYGVIPGYTAGTKAFDWRYPRKVFKRSKRGVGYNWSTGKLSYGVGSNPYSKRGIGSNPGPVTGTNPHGDKKKKKYKAVNKTWMKGTFGKFGKRAHPGKWRKIF